MILIINYLITVISTVLISGIWLFFFLHAVQRIEEPSNRAVWAIGFVVFNLFCIPVYIILKYKSFYKQGKGGLIRKRYT